MHQSQVCRSRRVERIDREISFSLGVTSSSLTIRNIKRSDDGEYTCISSNSIGHGQSSVYIRVQCNFEDNSMLFFIIGHVLFSVQIRRLLKLKVVE